jgi:hypothetical protein
MILDSDVLKGVLESLARKTWVDIESGDQLGVSMSETTITDNNMLALRREFPELLIRKHATNEEVRTGADWEWWLRTRDGWTSLVFQAKRLGRDGKYHGLTKRQPNGMHQVDVLIKTCWERSDRLGGAVWPLYCFYNSWVGGWPAGVSNLLQNEHHMTVVSSEDLPLFGCAVSDALTVRRIVTARSYARRRTSRDTHLPNSRPWSLLFGGGGDNRAIDLSMTLRQLSSWMSVPLAHPHRSDVFAIAGRERSLVAIESDAESEMKAVERSQERPVRVYRDRAMVWKDPALIPDPPQYVLDMLNGTPQPRRLKPLAGRVVVMLGDE